jgi:transcriptional regulator with XRE-family HTH domain
MAEDPETTWASLSAPELAARLSARRRERGLTLRAAAAEVGVSAATLSRVERGKHLPERDSLSKLVGWLGLTDVASGEPHPPGAATMEAVELHLRADKDLSAADAETIAQMVRLAYERLKRGAR